MFHEEFLGGLIEPLYPSLDKDVCLASWLWCSSIQSCFSQSK